MNITKTIILIGLGLIALIIAIGLVGNEPVGEQEKVKEPVGVIESAEVISEKLDMSGGADAEYYEYIDMLNYELKKLGGWPKVKGKTPIEALHEAILNRPVDKAEEMVRIHNKNYEAMPYKERREYLINKSR